MIAVDLALLLAVDCSYSIGGREFRLQLDGLAAAFRDPEIQAAVVAGPEAAIAVAVMEWSSGASQLLVVPWTRIDGAATALALADAIASAPRRTAEGATSLGGALQGGLRLHAACPFAPHRRVIDVSGDGRHNEGPPLAGARAAALEAGLTVNGLAITREVPTLDRYFAARLIGGPGAFVERTDDYAGFAAAIRRKLLRELALPGTAGLDPQEPGAASLSAQAWKRSST